MYEILKETIENTNYKLEEMLDKIYVLYAKNKLSKEEMEELETYVREKANPQNNYDYEKQLEEIFKRLEILEEYHKPEEPTEPEEEYPEYVAPSGAHDAYNTGDKITYKGKKYVCKMDGCVWSPEVYPSAWQEVVESEG